MSSQGKKILILSALSLHVDTAASVKVICLNCCLYASVAIWVGFMTLCVQPGCTVCFYTQNISEVFLALCVSFVSKCDLCSTCLHHYHNQGSDFDNIWLEIYVDDGDENMA